MRRRADVALEEGLVTARAGTAGRDGRKLAGLAVLADEVLAGRGLGAGKHRVEAAVAADGRDVGGADAAGVAAVVRAVGAAGASLAAERDDRRGVAHIRADETRVGAEGADATAGVRRDRSAEEVGAVDEAEAGVIIAVAGRARSTRADTIVASADVAVGVRDASRAGNAAAVR